MEDFTDASSHDTCKARMIKTLVTGGTGFVGRAITRQLVEQHETVQVLSRNPLAVPPEQRVPGALYVKGDILDPQSVAAAMQDCDAIVHCVQFPGAPFENPSKGWTYNNIDGRGTEILCEAAQKQNISRLLYISGAGAGQGRQQPWFQAKDRAEKAIVATGQQWTILRPSWIYGPEDRSLNRMVDSARLPIFFPIIGDGQQKVAPVLIDDMAKVIGYVLNREKFYQKKLEIGGPEILTFNEMMHRLLQVLQKKKIFIHLPPRIIKYIANIINMLPINPFITSDGIDFICMDVDINVSEAHALFDFAFTEFEKGLQKYL